jgi:hypothetical protein
MSPSTTTTTLTRVAIIGGVSALAYYLRVLSAPAAALLGLGGSAVVVFVLPRLSMPTGCKHIRPFIPGHAPVRVQRMYLHANKALAAGVAGPIAAFGRGEMIAGPCWTLLYESMLAHTKVDRYSKEAVAAAVSRSNACHYCIDANSKFMLASPSPAKDGTDASMRVEDTSALQDWAASTRYTPSNAMAGSISIPFRPDQAPEIVGVVIAYNFINRVAEAFVGDFPLSRLPKSIQQGIDPLVLAYLRRSARVVNPPGESFHVLAASDPVYGSSNVPIERAEEELPSAIRKVLKRHANMLLAAEVWSRACARAVRSTLRKESRDIVRNFAHSWDGRQRLSTQWATEMAAESPHESDRLLLHVALLTVVGGNQLSDSELRAAVSARGDDAAVNVVAYAAAEAAKVIAERVCNTIDI